MAPEFGRWCSEDKPPGVVTTGNHITLHLLTNGNSAFTGFLAAWKFIGGGMYIQNVI